jgi:alkylated DNA repair dioxygenase AlkB
MNLFGNSSDLFDAKNKAINLLPKDGDVHYHGKIFTDEDSEYYYISLLNGIEWQNDQAFIYGKLITTKRKVAWYGDSNFEYTYSKITKQALPWTRELMALKSITENATGESYNSCLLNLYHNGEEGMAWHSDAEKTLKENGAIASLSFGAERKFSFKHKITGEITSLILQHGSLLLMKGVTQKNWLHRLPPTKQKFGPRINLTFRTIVSTN